VIGLTVAVVFDQRSLPDLGGVVRVTFGFASFMLGFVVLVGYAGQVSLAQWALAGFGAWGRRAIDERAAGFSLVIATIVAVAATIPAGLVFAVPALRTRGINLAVATSA